MLQRFTRGARLASLLSCDCKQALPVGATKDYQSQASHSAEQGTSAIETPDDVVTARTDEVKKVTLLSILRAHFHRHAK